jgi:PII-like signaling protein
MTLPQDGSLLRIFIGERDKHDGIPLYEWLVMKAREYQLAGATVVRGIMGYGARSRIQSFKVERLSTDLPIIVEVVDTFDKLDGFLRLIDDQIKDGLVTMEKAQVRLYRTGPVE